MSASLPNEKHPPGDTDNWHCEPFNLQTADIELCLLVSLNSTDWMVIHDGIFPEFAVVFFLEFSGFFFELIFETEAQSK